MEKVHALTAIAEARRQSLAPLAVARILRLDVMTLTGRHFAQVEGTSVDPCPQRSAHQSSEVAGWLRRDPQAV